MSCHLAVVWGGVGGGELRVSMTLRVILVEALAPGRFNQAGQVERFFDAQTILMQQKRRFNGYLFCIIEL